MCILAGLQLCTEDTRFHQLLLIYFPDLKVGIGFRVEPIDDSSQLRERTCSYLV